MQDHHIRNDIARSMPLIFVEVAIQAMGFRLQRWCSDKAMQAVDVLPIDGRQYLTQYPQLEVASVDEDR
jgi:hypothetical protein